jgi:UDP-glucose 4-epimerase
MEKLFEEYKIDAVIHFAAFKAVGESVAEPLKYYSNNIESFVTLLEVAAKYGVNNIVFSSSATVYGQPDVLPATEQTPSKPATSPYGNTKQMCEDILRDTVAASASLKGIALRYFNPIGAHPSAEIGELPLGVPQNLIPYLTQTAIGIRQELSVFGNDYNTPDGSCIRDYINVVDLAKAHVIAMGRMIEKKSDSNIETFNLGTGRGVSVLELINSFERATGVKVPHKIVGRREGDIEQVWANPEYANNVLGWKAVETLDDTLASAWKWQVKLREKGIM